jgi:hypothetical protein
MINTRGSVHGKTIIDRPAAYAITIHERYAVCSFPSIVKTVPSEKIIPKKINENNTNEITTIDFFAITTEDMYHITYFDT